MFDYFLNVKIKTQFERDYFDVSTDLQKVIFKKFKYLFLSKTIV